MKKVLLGSAIALLTIGSTSCGGSHTCDAYRKADYTKSSKKQSQKAVVKTAIQKVVNLK